MFFSVQSAAGSTLAVQQWKMLDRNDTLDRVNYYNIILQVGTSLFCTAWKCMVMYMINLLPFISFHVRCYPECIEEVRPRYKRRQPRSGREAANGSCSTVLLFTVYTVLVAILRGDVMIVHIIIFSVTDVMSCVFV